MQIRQSSAGDLPAIADLFLDCVQVSHAGVLSDEVRQWVDYQFLLKLWIKALESNLERKTYLAFVDHQVAGLYRIGPEADNPAIGHLFSLYVYPNFAGRGIGRRLFSQAIETLEASGFADISLWVFAENQFASSFYRKFGFEHTEISRTTDGWQALEIKMLRSAVFH